MYDILFLIFSIIIFGGGALVVTFFIIKSFFDKESSKIPLSKWILVLIISLGQVGCWHMLNDVNHAFNGKGKPYNNFIYIFILIVSIWYIYQIAIIYLRKNKLTKHVSENNKT